MSHCENAFGGSGAFPRGCGVFGKIDSGKLEDYDFVIAFSFRFFCILILRHDTSSLSFEASANH